MSIEMVPLQIIGLKVHMPAVIHALRGLGSVHIDGLSSSQQVSARPLTLDQDTIRHKEELNFTAARVDGLLEALGGKSLASTAVPTKDILQEARAGVAKLMPEIHEINTRRAELENKLASLPRYEITLRKLLPIIPASAREPGNVSIGVLVSRAHVGALDGISHSILELTSGRAEMIASDVDDFTRAMLIVFPAQFTREVETLLGREDVSRLVLPDELGKGPPDVAMAALQRQLAAIPVEIHGLEGNLAELADQWKERLSAWSNILHEEIDTYNILSRFGETDMTFVLIGWVPAGDLEKVKARLQENTAGAVIVEKLAMTQEMKNKAPIILQNPALAKPFESLVSLVSLPRYGHIDPTRLMALFLPIFFGMILGDVGYGALLMALSLGLSLKFRSGIVRDILRILSMGSGWAIFFGLMYGEAFGTLGEHYGMHALWFDRASSEHVAGLLILSLVAGAIHLTLGLALGVWEAIQDRNKSHLLERGGMLVALVGLFVLVGVLAGFLPSDFRTPAVSGVIIGIVLLSASLGWLGLIMGPIEFIGLIGNLLSYLRIAAIGLASVYLAKVANDMVGMLGNIIVGAIVAILLHALNLVLGAFSPTIHSLRLHYVEFFRKFYEGGGRLYEPFKSHLPSSF